MSWFKKKETQVPIITAEEARKLSKEHLTHKIGKAEEKIFNYIMEDIRNHLVVRGTFKHTYDIETLSITTYAPVPDEELQALTANISKRLTELGYWVDTDPIANYFLKVEW